MTKLSPAAKAFISLTVLAGIAVLVYASLHLRPEVPLKFFAFLALALATSRLRVKIPGMNGIMSVNLPFFLIAAAKLSIGEALIIACLGSLAQSLGRSGHNKPVQIVFNAAALTNAVGLAALTFAGASQQHFTLPVAIVGAGGAYLLGNTVQITLVLWLAEGKTPAQTWMRMTELTVPYYLLSASIAATACVSAENVGWTIALLVFAAMYVTYRSYRLYFASFAAGSGIAKSTVAG